MTAAIWNRAVQEAKLLAPPDADFPLSATLDIAEREAWSAISRQWDAAADAAWLALPRDEQERRAAAPASASLAALPALAGMRVHPACAAMFCPSASAAPSASSSVVAVSCGHGGATVRESAPAPLQPGWQPDGSYI